MSKAAPLWRRSPVAKDFEAALSFLALLYPAGRARHALQGLRRAKTVKHAAKDLLRASRLPLLPRDEPQVEADLKRLRKGKSLSPVLLIQGDLRRGVPLTIADGYHRVCALYYYDENAPVSCCVARA
jgi:hypothetical protein